MVKDIQQEMQEYPFVSVIVPMYNEENYIEYCLDSLINQTYPTDRMEVIVVDGMSSDRSREIVKIYQNNHSNVKLIDNPKRIVPVAMNIGIKNAQGEILIWMSAHSQFKNDFISRCVSLLQKTGAANVGGVLEAVGTNYLGKAIAIAATNPFGVGDALYRFSDKKRWVDTVFPGAWYKKTIEEVGGFNEDMVVNQDYELNYRLRKAGGKILLSPDIRCRYFVRSSLYSLMKQYFRYGFWRVKTLVLHPDSLRWRQIAAPLFVLGLIISALLIPVSTTAAFIIPLLYFIFNVSASIFAAVQKGLHYLPVLPVIFLIIHLSWGTGFWGGIIKFGIPKFSLESLKNAFNKNI